MATLISSKQIEGIVTASIIHGEFQVSGSFINSGSYIISINTDFFQKDLLISKF